jgi:hypothetical protein
MFSSMKRNCQLRGAAAAITSKPCGGMNARIPVGQRIGKLERAE